MLPPPGGIGHTLALPQIAAAAEGALRTRQNQTQGRVFFDIEGGKTIAQLGHHLRVHGVADLGSIEGENAHPVRADFDFHGLIAHGGLVGAVALLPCTIACPPTGREGGRARPAWLPCPALFPAPTWL